MYVFLPLIPAPTLFPVSILSSFSLLAFISEDILTHPNLYPLAVSVTVPILSTSLSCPCPGIPFVLVFIIPIHIHLLVSTPSLYHLSIYHSLHLCLDLHSVPIPSTFFFASTVTLIIVTF